MNSSELKNSTSTTTKPAGGHTGNRLTSSFHEQPKPSAVSLPRLQTQNTKWLHRYHLPSGAQPPPSPQQPSKLPSARPLQPYFSSADVSPQPPEHSARRRDGSHPSRPNSTALRSNCNRSMDSVGLGVKFGGSAMNQVQVSAHGDLKMYATLHIHTISPDQTKK